MTTDVLTEAQRAFLRAFAASRLASSFVLSGGTALAAYYFRHRLSDDLDLFSRDPVDGAAVRAFLKGLDDLDRYREQHIFERNIFMLALRGGASLKVEFTRYPFDAIEPPTDSDGLRVDSLRDIGANKVAAFADRADAKDAFDLYAFMKHDVDFEAMVSDAEKKFRIAGLRYTLESRLLSVGRIADWPSPLEPFSAGALVARFRDEARSLVQRDIGQ